MKSNGPLQYGKMLHDQFTLLSFLGQVLTASKRSACKFQQIWGEGKIVQAKRASEAEAQTTSTGLA